MVGLPSAIWRWTFSISTVASSTRMPTDNASPPSVIRLMVSPSALSVAMDASTERGNGDGDDQRAPPGAQKQQNHQGRQRRGDHALLRDAIHGRADEERLVRKFPDLHLGRQAAHNPRHGPSHGIHDPERRSRAAPENGDQHPAHAVQPHNVQLGLKSVVHLRHVADADHGGVDRLDRQVVQRRQEGRAGVQGHGILRRADLHAAARGGQDSGP